MTNTLFEWDIQYETGVKKIDQQHYKLIEIINSLFKRNLSSNKDSDLNVIINELEHYVVEHFDTEEAMMEEMKIDQRHQMNHRKLHHDFTLEVQNIFTKVLESEETDLEDFAEYLVRWLAYHILSVDKSLSRQLEFIKSDGLSSEEAFEKDQEMYVASAEPLLKALKVLYNTVLEKNKEIEKQNHELEETVKQRTNELQVANDKLSKQVLTDTLTSLPNRRYALKEIEAAFSLNERYGNEFSIIFVDVDKFKSVNDTYGHDIGDEVLIWISKFLTDTTRKTDVVCRLGGDEFLILVKESKYDQALELANKIDDELKKEHDIQRYWQPSLSLGVASIDDNVSNASDLIKAADDKMYVAKQSGGGVK